MFEVVLTQRDFKEVIAQTVTTEAEAQESAREYGSENRPNVLRVHWRPVRNILERCFYDSERQLIEEALKKLSPDDLNFMTLGNQVERVIVQEIAEGGFPWVDPDMAATAIAKLHRLSPEQRRKVLSEFYGKKH